MPYKFQQWTLYCGTIDTDLENNRKTYFFSRWTQKHAKPSDIPQGYEVEFNDRIGLPTLRQKF